MLCRNRRNKLNRYSDEQVNICGHVEQWNRGAVNLNESMKMNR